MRLGPVGALSRIHGQRHVEPDGGVGGGFHHPARRRDGVLDRALWHLEQQLLGGPATPEAQLEALRAVTPAALRAAGRRLALDTTFALRPEVRA